MLKRIFYRTRQHLRPVVLLLAVGIFTSTLMATFLSPTASAAEFVSSSVKTATTYAWKDRQTISVTGGSVKSNQGIRVDASSDQPKTGSGSVLMNEVWTVKDCVMWIFCSESEQTVECFVNLTVTFSGTGLSRGTLTTVRGASAGNSGGVTACTQSTHDAYNNKTISIGGTRPSDGGSTVEEDAQKLVSFVVHSDFSDKEAPKSVRLKISGATTRDLTASKSTLSGVVTFTISTKLEPGNYTANVENPPEGLVVSESSFKKVKFQHLTVNLGEAEGFSNRQIEAEITLTSKDPSAKTYGPLSLYLYGDAEEIIAQTQTNSAEMSAVTEGSLGERTIYLKGVFDDINSGAYRLCVGSGNSLCQQIVKEEGKRKKVDFKATDQEITAAAAEDGASSCAIEGVGWIICPVLIFLGDIADKSFEFLSGSFLETKPGLVDQSSETYTAWSFMRNIANVAFVIVFLVIIFSQLSNVGITNYGVKKMLPRLIVAAILVNLSFFICQIAVDLSNILGKSLYDVFGLIPTGSSGVEDGSTHVGGWVVLITTLIAGGIGLAFAISVPVLLAALVAILMVALILVLRIALIVLLTVISPLAFVAYLLPNTEQWFKKWAKTFSGLLLVYPIIAVVFGASALASRIINNVGGETDTLLLQAVAMGVAAIPFFVVPSLLKNSMNAAGGIGTKLAGWSSKANSRIGGKVNDTSRLGQYNKYRQGEANKRRALIQSGAYEGKGGRLNPRNWASTVNKGINNSRLSGDFGNKQAAAGVLLAENQEAEETKAAAARLRSMKPDRNALRQLSKGGMVNGIDGSKDTSLRAAAIQSVVASNDIRGMNDLWSESRTWSGANGDKLRTTLADSLQNSSGRPAYFGQGAIAGLRVGGSEHNLSAAEVIEKAIKDGAYSPARIATADKDELAAVADIANSSVTLDVAAHQKLVNDAHTALTDPELARTIGKNLPSVEQIRGNMPHNPNEERFV